MYQRKLDKDIRCPLEYGLEIFGGKWKSRIICVLAKKIYLDIANCEKRWAISLMQFLLPCLKN